MAGRLKYAEGDLVQCYWDSIKFQARVARVDPAKHKNPYLVHYQGWKSRWDEWVGEARLVGRGTGPGSQPPGKKKAPVKRKASPAPPPPPPAAMFGEEEEELLEPTPTLERTMDGGRIVYRMAGGKTLKSLAEVRRFCASQGLIFDTADYDFASPVSPPKAKPRAKGRGRKPVAQPPTREELMAVEVSGGPAAASSSSTNLLDEGLLLSEPHHHSAPPRGLKTAGAGSLAKTKAPKRRRKPSLSQQEAAPSAAYHSLGDEEETKALTEMLADIAGGRVEPEEGEEFIEIQAPDEAGEGGSADDDGGPPVLAPISQHPPLEEADARSSPPRKLLRGHSGVVATPGHRLHKRSAYDPIDYGAIMGEAGLGMEELESLNAYGRGPATPPSLPSVALQGIRVTGQAPPPDVPSRVFMKLRAPDAKVAKGRHRVMPMRVGPEGMEYLDSSYTPAVHTGGRGRFGVIGTGPPPAPIVPDRPEDFHYLPPEVAGDHCYGKSGASAGLAVGGPGAGGQRRVPAHLLPTALSRVQSVRLVGPGGEPAGATYHFPTSAALPQMVQYVEYDDGLGGEVGVVAAEGGQMEVYDGYGGGGSASLLQGSSDRLPANILEGVDDDAMEPLR